MERNRKNYTEVAVFGFYVPSLWTLACRMIRPTRRTAVLSRFSALISTELSYRDSDWNHVP